MEGRKDNRQRRSIQVQMDMGKPHERSIFEYHEKRKKEGGWKVDFVKAISLYRDLLAGQADALRHLFPRIVDAVNLFLDIEKGSVKLMKELFPHQFELFRLQLEADILEGLNLNTQKDVLKELRTIKAEIEALKATGIQLPSPVSGGIKQIGTLAIPSPNFDDQDDEDLFSIRKDENATQRIANNFIASIGRAQSVQADPSVKIGRQK